MWQDHRQIIELLATLWPKAFFVDTRQRLPLKKLIERDIKAHEVELAAGQPVDVVAAINYYRDHIDYHHSMLAGATRYDLNGNPAGTVTKDEEIGAQQRIVEIRKMLRERREQEQRRLTPVGRVLQAMPGIADDQYRKIPAPALSTPPVGRPTRNADRNREIARRYAAGESSTALAREFGLSPKTVRDAVEAAGGTLRAQGGHRPRKHVPTETKQAVIARYQAGDHVEDISRDCEVSHGMVYLILHAAGIPLRGPARGPRKKAAAKVTGIELRPVPLGAWKTPSAHYALRRVYEEPPVVAVTVTYQRGNSSYRPGALRPYYQQVRRRVCRTATS